MYYMSSTQTSWTSFVRYVLHELNTDLMDIILSVMYYMSSTQTSATATFTESRKQRKPQRRQQIRFCGTAMEMGLFLNLTKMKNRQRIPGYCF
ncbi:hypothetical protein Bpfe_011711 [Biomphalaria pfeifferi]|uniref:Uncharacterized protein n=1 Tax=Biomphalaria pfeifferi TaxID=112525 RepID=A0AAD8FCV3_BIOPF|nr:hypothetical protein Bpfe_011711 [Biomphalaria pfeifferi]